MFDKIAADRLDLDRPSPHDVASALLRESRRRTKELLGLFHELDGSPRTSTGFNSDAFGRARDAIEAALDEVETRLSEVKP